MRSSAWEIEVVEETAQVDLEPHLKRYDVRMELQPNQIQMGDVWSAADREENVITVPSLEELPLVSFELEKLAPTSDGEGNYVYRRNPVYTEGK